MKPFGSVKRVNILFLTIIFLSFNSNINVMGNSFRKLSGDYLTNVKCDSFFNNTCVCQENVCNIPIQLVIVY